MASQLSASTSPGSPAASAEGVSALARIRRRRGRLTRRQLLLTPASWAALASALVMSLADRRSLVGSNRFHRLLVDGWALVRVVPALPAIAAGLAGLVARRPSPWGCDSSHQRGSPWVRLATPRHLPVATPRASGCWRAPRWGGRRRGRLVAGGDRGRHTTRYLAKLGAGWHV